jgi:2-oxoisovalerate dehydrogenase E1 component
MPSLRGIPAEELLQLYRTMVLIRETEERIADLVRDEKVDESGELVYDEQGNVVRLQKEVICPCHLYTGQEAIAAGVCAHLNWGDTIFSAHRCHGHYLAKGGNLNAMMAELFGCITGCAEGRGGSMHLVDPEVGILGTTPIVASSIGHAVGAALAARIRGEAKVAVSFFGDGATEEGRFHEALNIAAAMKLPIVFVCENNLYSSHVRIDQRRAVDTIHLHAVPFGIPGLCADGNNLFEVYQTAKEAVERARFGGGPSLLEYRTYRWRGHVGGNLDLEKGIRTRSEFDLWKERDPLVYLEKTLVDVGILSAEQASRIRDEHRLEVLRAIDLARMGPRPKPEDLLKYVLADSSAPLPQGKPAVRLDTKDNPVDHDLLGYGEAIREATEQLMEVDPRVFIIGQGVNSPWYVGSSTTGLHRRFGPLRVIETPISEDTVTAATIGASMVNMRPVVIHPRVDFALLAVEQLIGQAANWHYMTAGKVKVPFVARLIVNRGGEQAAQHSQSLQAMFAHVPGLKVVMPSTAHDAKGLMTAAILSDDPVIFIDDRWAYGEMEEVPRDLYTIPLGKGIIRREGTDLTLVATSYMNRRALEAAETLAGEGLSVEVIDPRTIKPLDEELILASVAKTGRLVVADGGWDAYGFTAEVAALVASDSVVMQLKAPVVRLGLPPSPAPMSGVLERAYFKDVPSLTADLRRLMRDAYGMSPDARVRPVEYAV